MLPELRFYIKAVSRLIYFVTEEEDRFLKQFAELQGKDKVENVKVYNAAFGLVPLAQVIGDWKGREHKSDTNTMNIHEALINVYKDETPTLPKYYVITDPDRWLKEDLIQRRILNILHQVHSNPKSVKSLIFVGPRRLIPEKLARYMEVVQDSGISSDEITQIVAETCKPLNLQPPDDLDTLFKGLTSFEVQAAVIQTFKKTRQADPKLLASYRLKQLRKTDLIQYVDVSPYTFDSVGGAGRFKAWAHRMRAAWSRAGHDFGLRTPKGMLAIGMWGAGKSLSVKALGNTWKLPVVQMEMGRLRSSGVGDTEANVYRAIKIIESVSPCLLWIDEGEKSLAGSHSSSHSDAGTTSRMLGIFSTWMQETDAPVFTAITANSVKTLPVEIVTRMNQRWFFDLPSLEDRIDILKIHLLARKQNPTQYNLHRLSEIANTLVGREIEQCIDEAMILSYVNGQAALEETVLANELEGKPRIVNTMIDEIRETLDWVGFDPKIQDGVRARFAADPKGQDRKFSIE